MLPAAWPLPSRIPAGCSPEIAFSTWRPQELAGLIQSAVTCWVLPDPGLALTLSSSFREPEWASSPHPTPHFCISGVPDISKYLPKLYHLNRGAGLRRKPAFWGTPVPRLLLWVIWSGQLETKIATNIIGFLNCPLPSPYIPLKGKKDLHFGKQRPFLSESGEGTSS